MGYKGKLSYAYSKKEHHGENYKYFLREIIGYCKT